MKKFYCQECGTEVPLDADNCPKCNSCFSSVLCPKCDYTGPSRMFNNGCPKCGHLKRVIKTKPIKSKNLSLLRFITLFVVLITALIVLLYQF